MTEKRAAGKHILTGETIYKDVPAPKPVPNWATPDRMQYLVHTDITGSFGNRRIILKKGEWVYLNKDELAIFRQYVSGAGKA